PPAFAMPRAASLRGRRRGVQPACASNRGMDVRLQRWMYAAAGYNAVWGTAVVIFAHPVAWKCVGMLVAVYAPAVRVRLRDPRERPRLVARIRDLSEALPALGVGRGSRPGRSTTPSRRSKRPSRDRRSADVWS